MTALEFSPIYGRPLRVEAPELIGTPTRQHLERAVEAGHGEAAGQWLDYYLFELEQIRQIFGLSDWDLVRYYLHRQGAAAWEQLVVESLAPWLATTLGVPGQLCADVRVSDSSAVLEVPALPWPVEFVDTGLRYEVYLGSAEAQVMRWSHWRSAAAKAATAGDLAGLRASLDLLVGEARFIHDILCDWEWALLTVMAREWGEAALGDVFRASQESWLQERYERMREMSIAEYLQLKSEEMRGHFSGPAHAGQFQVVDLPDRYELTFDACGTGGRMRRGDPARGSGPRDAAPYNFIVVQQAYPWTWNRAGVCGYCAHCSLTNQIRPIEVLGRPLRMTLYPDAAGEACRWLIYKDPTAYPAEAYTSVGLPPPG